MTTYQADEIKESVKRRYGAVARQGVGCGTPADQTDCCSPTDVRLTTKTGADSIVAEADLGLGCGSPTAFGDIQPGDTVLDLGSGAGVDVFRAAGTVGPDGHVIGVDMTPDMIDLANTNAAKAGLDNVEFRLGEIEHLPVVDGTVDVVLSNCVINLVPDKRRAFAEIHRVLASGGRFVISDIVTIGDLADDVRADLQQWTACISGAIDHGGYLAIIEETGFVDIDVITSHTFGEGGPTRSITVRGFKR
jgi:SAM-dependent methyltransferase